MNDEKVFQLLMQINPVPDPDGLDSPIALTPFDRRSPTMTTGEGISPELANPGRLPPRNRQSRLLIGAAAALLVLAVGVGTWAVVSGDGEDIAAEVSVVMSHYEAWNNGDLDGYLATFTDELAQDDEADLAPILMNANEVIEIVEPCRVIETSTTGDATVECSITRSDDYQGPAGIIQNITDTFVVNADGKISSVESDGDCCSAQFAFNLKFWQWLQLAYPDVFEEIRPIDDISMPGWQRDPADMLIAIQYVEEFVAQSDDYPINP